MPKKKTDRPHLVTQPGYASGDQFGIAAKLINEPKAKVVVCQNENKPSSFQIESFYKEFLTPDRVLTVQVDLKNYYDDGKLKNAANTTHNKKNTHLTTNHSVGTQFVAGNWNENTRGKLREAWQLQGKDDNVQAWLDTKGLTADAINDKKVAVIWSRFSGKKGGAHPEHDTSHEGMRQMVESLKNDFDTIIIVGDRHPNHAREPGREESVEDPWAQLQNENTGPKGRVVDLTEFWKGTEEEKQKLQQWGGHTRIGQFKLYDHLSAQSQGLVHLGFRSGNLEAMALMGHKVGYMEQKHSLGGPRMDTWQRAKSGGLHYDKILLDQVPTRTGRQLTSERVFGSIKASSASVQEQSMLAGDQINAYSQHKTPQKLGSYPGTEGHSKHKEDAGTQNFKKGFGSTDLASITHFARASVLESAIEKHLKENASLSEIPASEAAARMMKLEDLHRDLIGQMTAQKDNVEKQMGKIGRHLESPLLTREEMIRQRAGMLQTSKDLGLKEGELRALVEKRNDVDSDLDLEAGEKQSQLSEIDQMRETLVAEKNELQARLTEGWNMLQENLDRMNIEQGPKKARSMPLNLTRNDLEWAMLSRKEQNVRLTEKIEALKNELDLIVKHNESLGITRPAPPPLPKSVAASTGFAKREIKSLTEQIRERNGQPVNKIKGNPAL